MKAPAKSPAEIAAERRKAILARAPLVPKGCCHFCGWEVPKLALWCETACARSYEDERAAVIK